MIRKATQEDAAFINEVMNHELVRPHVWEGNYHIDATDNIDLMWVVVDEGRGVMIAEPLGGGNYLGLVAYLPEHWGSEAIYGMRKAIRMLFETTDCEHLYGSVMPRNLRASRNLIGLGFKSVKKEGNRVTGVIDYIDMLDNQMFIETCKGGFMGKALYWWSVKAKIQDVPPYIPISPTEPRFLYDGEIVDIS